VIAQAPPPVSFRKTSWRCYIVSRRHRAPPSKQVPDRVDTNDVHRHIGKAVWTARATRTLPSLSSSILQFLGGDEGVAARQPPSGVAQSCFQRSRADSRYWDFSPAGRKIAHGTRRVKARETHTCSPCEPAKEISSRSCRPWAGPPQHAGAPGVSTRGAMIPSAWDSGSVQERPQRESWHSCGPGAPEFQSDSGGPYFLDMARFQRRSDSRFEPRSTGHCGRQLDGV